MAEDRYSRKSSALLSCLYTNLVQVLNAFCFSSANWRSIVANQSVCEKLSACVLCSNNNIFYASLLCHTYLRFFLFIGSYV